jgi:hypothetical protein
MCLNVIFLIKDVFARLKAGAKLLHCLSCKVGNQWISEAGHDIGWFSAPCIGVLNTNHQFEFLALLA